MSTLVIFRCLGDRLVGCAAGKMFKIPSLQRTRVANDRRYRNRNLSKAQRSRVDIFQWEREAKHVEKRARRVRVTFVFCGMVVIASSIVLIMAGLKVLNDSYVGTQGKTEELGLAIAIARQNTINLIQSARQSIPNMYGLVRGLDETAQCLDAANKRKIEIEAPFANISTSLVSLLEGLGNEAIPGTINVDQALLQAKQGQESISNELASLQWWYSAAVIFVVLVSALALIMVFGVVMAWQEREQDPFQRFQTCIALPIFAFLVNMAWLFTSGFSVVAVMTADVCTGSPGHNLVSIVSQKETTINPMMLQMMRYYIEGCSSGQKPPKPTLFLDDFNLRLHTISNASQQFLDQATGESSRDFTVECGSGTINDAMSNLTILASNIEEVSQQTNETIESIYCSNFNPITTEIFHSYVCHDGIGGLSVVFGMLLVIVVCSMIMVTLRVAWQSVEVDSHDVFKKQEVCTDTTAQATNDIEISMLSGRTVVHEDRQQQLQREIASSNADLEHQTVGSDDSTDHKDKSTAKDRVCPAAESPLPVIHEDRQQKLPPEIECSNADFEHQTVDSDDSADQKDKSTAKDRVCPAAASPLQMDASNNKGSNMNLVRREEAALREQGDVETNGISGVVLTVRRHVVQALAATDSQSPIAAQPRPASQTMWI